MVTRLLTLSILVISSTLLSCGKFQQKYQDVEMASAQESSCGFILNSRGYRISWRTHTPVTFYFEKAFPENMKVAVQRAADGWNKLSGKSLIVLSGETPISARSGVDGKNIIYWITDGVGFIPSEQAKTSVRWNDRNLTDADILMNRKYWNFYVDSPEDLYSVHLESLMVHEFGHALGLIHQNVFESVMYPTLRTNYVRDVPSPKPDLEGLECEYL